MKVNNFADKKKGLQGEQEDIVMGMDAENHLTLLNSLTHLYSNPVMAALREYCANASDAHKDSGQTRAFDVSFPYRYEGTSNLRIRDYGKGMTEAQITKVFSQYGATTKANNNAQVGGFGLGSKSGLAVSNYLFVNTIADGVLLKAKILKNQKNESVIRILSKEPTKAPSGTEIILPLSIPQLNELRAKAEEELVGYKSSQVNLNGDPITYTVHDKELFLPVQVGSNVVAYIAINDTQKQNTFGLPVHSPNPIKVDMSIIMGGVYYPSLPSMGSFNVTDTEFVTLTTSLNASLRNSPKIILNVPVGSVDLPPHRDSIIDTEKTWTSLKGLLANLRMGLPSATESYLNELSLAEASKTVGSMRALFAPIETWKHKGKNYDNDMLTAMTNVPFLFSLISHSYSSGHVKLDGPVSSGVYTMLHTRANTEDYNYTNHYMKKKQVMNLNLVVEKEKYDEIEAYYRNQHAHYTVRVKMNKPRVGLFITRYVKSVIEEKYGFEDFFVVVTQAGDKLPAHLACAMDVTVTEDIIKAEYRKLFPPEPKKAVEQRHCRLTKDGMRYSLVSSDENIVFFGGKGEYATEDFMQGAVKNPVLPQVAIMKKISRGTVTETTEYSWVQKGLLNLIPSNAALVAVGDTRAPKLFQKAFKNATPLGEIVMDFYDTLDADRKLAIHHAYSIVALWSAGSDSLFSILGDTCYTMKNKSIQLLFSEPELISVAHYVFAYKDSYVKGFTEWKKDTFMQDLKGKELAWKMLLPLQSLLEQVYYNYRTPITDGRLNTSLPLRCDRALQVDDLAEFVNRLTAN